MPRATAKRVGRLNLRDLPPEVPVLEAGDFCRGWHGDADGGRIYTLPDGGLQDETLTHCLLGWCDVTLNSRFQSDGSEEVSLKGIRIRRSNHLLQKLLQAEWEIAQEEGRWTPLRYYAMGDDGCPKRGHRGHIMSFNDELRIPKRVLARVWNRFTAKLGYTEGNPEA